MQTQNTGLTQGDLLPINAMVEVLALRKGFHRENAYFLIEQEFNVPHVSYLRREDVDKALMLLATLQDINVH